MTKGKRLELVRNHFQLSQKEMAIKLGVQQGSYSRMENDKSGFSENTIVILGDMGISSDWLLFGRGEMILKYFETLPESPPEDMTIVGELKEQMRSIRDDVDAIERTIEKLMGRRKNINV